MNTILLIHIGGDILPIYAAVCERWSDCRIESARLSPRSHDNSALSMAVERLINDGVKRLILIPLCLRGGAEYIRICDIAEAYLPRLNMLTITPPFLNCQSGLDALADIAVNYALTDGVDAAVLVGHGGADNSDLLRLENRIRKRGIFNIFTGALNGLPDIDAVAEKLKKARYRKIRVMPLTLNFGIHASRDICAFSDNAWTGALCAKGFDALPLKCGLCDYSETATLILNLIRNAQSG